MQSIGFGNVKKLAAHAGGRERHKRHAQLIRLRRGRQPCPPS
jgi:hypothetical protein